MNTLEQPLRDSHQDLIVDGSRISRAASRTPGRPLSRAALTARLTTGGSTREGTRPTEFPGMNDLCCRPGPLTGRFLNRLLRKGWGFRALPFVMSLSGIAVLFYALRSVFGDLSLPRQEFEGLGVVVCALAYIGVFLWRLSRALERDAQRVSEKWFGGSTGDPPVPAGDSQDGTGATVRANGHGLFATLLVAVPVGGSPTGAGGSPAPPIFKTSSQRAEDTEKPLETPSAVAREPRK
jgi:hypothetical protein